MQELAHYGGVSPSATWIPTSIRIRSYTSKTRIPVSMYTMPFVYLVYHVYILVYTKLMKLMYTCRLHGLQLYRTLYTTWYTWYTLSKCTSRKRSQDVILVDSEGEGASLENPISCEWGCQGLSLAFLALASHVSTIASCEHHCTHTANPIQILYEQRLK